MKKNYNYIIGQASEVKGLFLIKISRFASHFAIQFLGIRKF